jgi:hypothetical protein
MLQANEDAVKIFIRHIKSDGRQFAPSPL